jgi:hypothetical protein
MISTLTIVIFQGYLVFTRSNSIECDSWGFTVSPLLVIGSIGLLVFALTAKKFVMEQVWTWDIPKLQRVDRYNGVAPLVEADAPQKNKFLRGLL